MTAFTDLLHRDEYSLKHALGNTNQILPILKERGHTHFAVCNYGEISNWVQQLFACKDNGIVPILGMETYVNDYRTHLDGPDDIRVDCLLDGKTYRLEELTDIQRDLVTQDYPIGLFARTMDGYYNIIRIHNDAQLNGMDKRPRTSDPFLQSHGRGIVALMHLPMSEIGGLLYNGLEKEAEKVLERYRGIFDEVVFGIPIMEDRECSKIAAQGITFGKKHSIRCVPVLNSHYIHKEDEEAWNVMRQLSRLRGGVTYEIDSCPGMYYRSREETDALYHSTLESPEFPESDYLSLQSSLDELLSTFTLLDIDYSLKLPKFENGAERLREYAWEGFRKKGYDRKGKEYEDRLNYELDNIIGAGFADYFLVLRELYHWYSDDQKAMGAFGRGSAAGSLVLNCIGGTNLDPIEHHLLFERFLDAERFRKIVESGGQVSGADCPDVDTDSAATRREDLKRHLVDVYGEACTASIGTIGLMKTKSALKDLARLYDVPPEEVNAVTTQMHIELDEDGNEPSLEELKEQYPALVSLLAKYPKMADSFEKIRGSINTWGMHAGGVLISDRDLTDQLPVRRSGNGKIVTTWTEGIASRELGMMGFIKFDMLSIDQLNIIEDTLRLIKERTGKTIDPFSIPTGDYKALTQMSKHDGLCIFQFDTDLAGQVADQMGGIRCFEDLPALSTLMRPAALKNQFGAEFGRLRKSGGSVYIPDCLKPYLGDTYGLPIYQEHIMQAAMVLSGFDKPHAYKFMKEIYKGKLHSKEEIEDRKRKFVEGAQKKVDAGEVEPGYPEKLFDQLIAFMGYGFCKCLSLDTIIQTKRGTRYLAEIVPGDWVLCDKGYVKVLEVHETETVLNYAIFEKTYMVKCSLEHKFLCEDGEMRPLKDVKKGKWKVLTNDGPVKLRSILKMGKMPARDLTVDSEEHRFYANGVLVSNSHAYSYAMYSAVGLWLKAHYPIEFLCANLTVTARSDEKKGVSILDQRIRYAQSLGINVYPADVRYASDRWTIHNDGLMAPISNLKGLGKNEVDAVKRARPFSTITEFMDKTKISSSKFDILLFGGALDGLLPEGDVLARRQYLYSWYHNMYAKQKKKGGEERQLSFFEDDDVEEAFDVSSKYNFNKTEKEFTRENLDAEFLELNGFLILENLLIKYADYLRTHPEVKKIGEVKKGNVNKHVYMLCRIVDASPFTSKSGSEFVKLVLSDGTDTIETVMRASNHRAYKMTLRPGNVLALPMQLAEDGGVYLDDLNKREARILEK